MTGLASGPAGPAPEPGRGGRGRPRLVVPVLLLFVACGSWMVRDAVAKPGVEWMFVYERSALTQLAWSEVLPFVWRLRIPVPPALGLAELVALRSDLGRDLLFRLGYRAALVLSFAAAIAFAATSTRRLVAAAAVSLLFLYATTLIHPGNPRLYDVFYPLAFLTFLLTLGPASRARRRWPQILLAVAAGFFLSMAELLRPFAVLLLPALVLGGTLALPDRRRRLAFLLPIVLFSGVWHVHLWLDYEQLTFSNHGGFNLHRAWPAAPVPELVAEPHGDPLRPGLGLELNTEAHGENSRRLTAAVVSYWRRHPVASLRQAVERLGVVLAAPTTFNKHAPRSRWLPTYRVAVAVTGGWLLLQALLLAGRFARRPALRAWGRLLAGGENLLIGFTAASLVLLAIGDRGEEARFLLSLLPLLAALPVAGRAEDRGGA